MSSFLSTLVASRRIYRGILFLLTVGILYNALPFGGYNNRASPIKAESYTAATEKSRLCELYPDVGRIAVSVKTGASEAKQKVPEIPKTSLKCVKEPMIFSDLKEDLENGVHIHDVLARFDSKAMKK